MERHYFGLSTLLASVALLIWSIGETFAYPQGPNVSMGSNPIVNLSLNCSRNAPGSWTNTTGQTLILTDFGLTLGSSYRSYLRVDSVQVLNLELSFQQLRTGIKVEDGQTLECWRTTTSGSTTTYLSGYLAHQ